LRNLRFWHLHLLRPPDYAPDRFHPIVLSCSGRLLRHYLVGLSPFGMLLTRAMNLRGSDAVSGRGKSVPRTCCHGLQKAARWTLIRMAAKGPFAVLLARLFCRRRRRTDRSTGRDGGALLPGMAGERSKAAKAASDLPCVLLGTGMARRIAEGCSGMACIAMAGDTYVLHSAGFSARHRPSYDIPGVRQCPCCWAFVLTLWCFCAP